MSLLTKVVFISEGVANPECQWRNNGICYAEKPIFSLFYFEKYPIPIIKFCEHGFETNLSVL